MIRDECYGNFQSKQPSLQWASIDRILMSLITRNYINETIVNLVQIKTKKDQEINIIVTIVARKYYVQWVFYRKKEHITLSQKFLSFYKEII